MKQRDPAVLTAKRSADHWRVGQGNFPLAGGAWFAPVDSPGDGVAAATQGEGSEVVTGGCTVSLMLDTALGAQDQERPDGYGQNEFVPWLLGAVM